MVGRVCLILIGWIILATSAHAAERLKDHERRCAVLRDVANWLAAYPSVLQQPALQDAEQKDISPEAPAWIATMPSPEPGDFKALGDWGCEALGFNGPGINSVFDAPWVNLDDGVVHIRQNQITSPMSTATLTTRLVLHKIEGHWQVVTTLPLGRGWFSAN